MSATAYKFCHSMIFCFNVITFMAKTNSAMRLFECLRVETVYFFLDCMPITMATEAEMVAPVMEVEVVAGLQVGLGPVG
ncbi:hypothetical protein Q3G72_004248 [Acer saccharum]|nr:hypothetical protein Q3G72_004248 [Acer saccharum]